jgi:hypothetical protein
MMPCRIPILTAALLLSGRSSADAQLPVKSSPAAPTPSKSLPEPDRLTRSFDARGIQTVVLRAEAAQKAEVKTVPAGRLVTVSGIPEGGAPGYHSTDPNWRETPASRWGLDFRAKFFGPTLVVSTEQEMAYIHHYYHLGSLSISVPEGVTVIKENRKLTGEPAPDLSPPANH